MTIGARIKKRRLELGLSQEEVALKAGYKSRSSINKLESSRTLPLSKVEKMAHALECTPGFLMGWDTSSETIIENEREYKLDIYRDFGYTAYYLVEVSLLLDEEKQKELINYAKYLLSTSKIKKKIMSEAELRKLTDFTVSEREINKVILELYRVIGEEENENLNAAHERTDIEVTEEMKKHDDDFFDEED